MSPLSIAVLCAGVFCNCFMNVWLVQSERATFHCACADYSAALPGLQTLVKGAQGRSLRSVISLISLLWLCMLVPAQSP